MKQIALTSLLLSALLLLACSEQPTTEKYQKSRDNIVDVKDKVVEINTGDVLIGNNSIMYFVDNYWMVVEYGFAIMDKIVHLFDRTTYEPVLDAVKRGQGPGEFANHGIPIVDEAHHCFYPGQQPHEGLYLLYRQFVGQSRLATQAQMFIPGREDSQRLRVCERHALHWACNPADRNE